MSGQITQSAFDPTKCIPDAKIGDYYICIYPDVPEQCTGGIVGFVGNHSNADLRLNIELDNAFMRERNYRTVCLFFDSDNYSKSSIALTSAFWESLKQNECLCAALWHEVGHFHTTRYFNTPFNGKSAQKYREELLSKREIMPEEKAADLFAMYYTSREDIVKAINWLIKTRKELVREPEDKKTRAVYEMGLRKRYLNSLTSEEDVKKELCQLCGISEFDLI